MNNRLNEKDIQKLLAWKGQESPTEEYFVKMKSDILSEIDSQKNSNSSHPHQQSGLSWTRIFTHPLFGLGATALIVMVVLIQMNQNGNPAKDNLITESPSLITNPESALTSPSRDMLNLRNVDSSGTIRDSAGTVSTNRTATRNPHFPFGESEVVYPTSPWPRKESK